MFNKLKQRSQGFTIIEVLIVLAIAGLIMLIVFLAVPALQRNSRNTQYKNGAAAILAAVNESVNNNNGTLPAFVNIASNGDIFVGAATPGTQTGKTQGGYTASVGTAAPAATSTGVYVVVNNKKCDGNALATGTANRSVVVLYNIETGSGTPALQCTEG